MKKTFGNWGQILGNSQLHLALRAYWPLVLLVSLNMLAQAGLTLVQPWPIRTMIDHVVENPTHAHGTAGWDLFRFVVSSVNGFLTSSDFDFLFKGIGILLIICLLSSILLYFQNIILARLGQKAVLYIRQNLFSQLIFFPHSFFEKAQTGDLTSRIFKDTAEVQDIVESLITLVVRSVPTVLGILVVCFALDWVYALTFVFVIPLVYWVNAVFIRRTKDAVRQQRSIEGRMASDVQEALYYHKAVATLSLEDNLVKGFLRNGSQSALYGVQAGRFQGLLTSSIDLLVGGTSVLVLFVGVLRIMHGCLTVGQLMVFLSYLNSIFKPIREISKFASRIASSAAALERIEEITRVNPEELGATELPDAVEAPPFRGDIQLEGVTFGYQSNRDVLENFSLAISAGQNVAVVGPSGSGKSTILQLFTRLYDPQKGQIKIDGIDIRNFKHASLRKQMAVVLQESFIFNATIEENIAIAKPGATRREVVKAAKAAAADDFIRGLPQGYDTPLGEGGAGLSGGQKRRLSVARAFLRNAPIVLLDEPTTGLDPTSEQEVMEGLRRLTKGKTTIVVTHQLSTATDADLIVVLTDGKILESGTHEELWKRDGAYRQLWDAEHGGN